ncbi:monovalent cation/H(+) antiporter subunit G [Petrotoga olearia]|jgi:multicomponent Na+:H+ antiporter subunit G|uniref:Cation:proton antiporter n=2 Tax=Petrotoga olearia TaxID=156203 RepID=A0A2K1P4K4_9BACT|nr:monovalent cation/H(+) antiporter subunit G [Petrotoga olearia]KUK16298.1 MAG: Monovalent cation/proton antiporter, MnhG/PhaG subunit [Petrotoga mobilis]PNR97712.1 cation:proton antiporter [Petrotoga olearia DSM 13574]RMA76725.1 multicomponent Na+:H+ antiporter subunit G [Petrotoga olearia]HBT51341.1 Na+/H+ antiporter subunit G [Petrotoga sp.]
MKVIGDVLIIIGGIFYLLGGLGIFRMPDVFNRIQAGTKATTLGAFSLILGVGFLNPSWLLKSIILVIFMTITNPVGSSVLARASYLHGAKIAKLQKDDLKSLYEKEEMSQND